MSGRAHQRRDGAGEPDRPGGRARDGAPAAASPPVRVPLDLPIHVERMGRGEPIVLLHGFGASQVTWRYWAPELARTHTVYLVDLRGFGSAPRLKPARYGPADMADDVSRMILALDLKRVTLIGHSMGGGIALLIAMLLRDQGEGDRVARLISVAGTAYEQKIPYYVNMLRRPSTKILVPLVPTRWVIRKVLESILYDRSRVSEEQVELYTRPLRPWPAKRAAVAAALQVIPPNLDDIVARYSGLDVPTLLLWGRQDPVVPLSVAERLARELPDARLVVLERCGHMPTEELPEESLAVVRRFLEEKGSGSERG